MLYRLLGKLFFYFYVIPSIVNGLRFARPHIARTLAKAIEDITKEQSKNAPTPDRRNTPRAYREHLDRQ